MSNPSERHRLAAAGIVLPATSGMRVRRPIDRNALDEALEAGRFLGFVAREPAMSDMEHRKRKPGRRRREPQDRLSVPGPRRVTQAFRSYCTAHSLTHWEALERLMDASSGGFAPVGDHSGTNVEHPGPFRTGEPAATASGGAPRMTDVSGQFRAAVSTTVAMPAAMGAWVEARGRSGRYRDVGDYICDLVRRDQGSMDAVLQIEESLEAGAPKKRSNAFDLAAFSAHRRSNLS